MVLRKKIAIGVLSLSMVGGVGTVFAATNAGDQLQNWYNSQFGIATNTVSEMLDNREAEFSNQLNSDKQAIIVDKTAAIEAAGNEERDRAIQAIGQMKDGYVKQINDKKSKIEEAMPGQFNDYVEGLKDASQTYVNQEGDNAQTEISAAIDNQASQSLLDITVNVTDAKDAAKKELTDKIQTAKKELQALIDAQKNAADTAVQTNLQAQIEAKKAEIEAAVEQLEAAKKQDIEAEGSRIQAEAQAALDDIVNEINGAK